MDTMVEGTLAWTEVTEADIRPLAELREAIEYMDDPIQRLSEGDLRQRFLRAELDPLPDALVGRDRAGTLVAYCWNQNEIDKLGRARVWLDGGVHPGWRHRSIGRRLVDWQLARAVEWFETLAPRSHNHQPLWVGSHVDSATALGQTLLQAGLVPVRWYFDMHARLVGNPSVRRHLGGRRVHHTAL